MALRDRKGDFAVSKCGYRDCGFVFMNKESGKVHMKTHDPQKDVWYHKCPFYKCTAAFIRRQEYRDHMHKVHNIGQRRHRNLIVAKA